MHNNKFAKYPHDPYSVLNRKYFFSKFMMKYNRSLYGVLAKILGFEVVFHLVILADSRSTTGDPSVTLGIDRELNSASNGVTFKEVIGQKWHTMVYLNSF